MKSNSKIKLDTGKSRFATLLGGATTLLKIAETSSTTERMHPNDHHHVPDDTWTKIPTTIWRKGAACHRLNPRDISSDCKNIFKSCGVEYVISFLHCDSLLNSPNYWILLRHLKYDHYNVKIRVFTKVIDLEHSFPMLVCLIQAIRYHGSCFDWRMTQTSQQSCAPVHSL